jgi:hypothetical protein
MQYEAALNKIKLNNVKDGIDLGNILNELYLTERRHGICLIDID